MACQRSSSKGIFCLEGDWSGDFRRPSSVEPIFSFLRNWNPFHVPYIHKDVVTVEQFERLLDEWVLKRYRDYPILYLGFHGKPGELYVEKKCRLPHNGTVGLDWLESQLAGKCKGRIVFFASCATLDVHGNRLNRFLSKTGALAICGYRAEVDWLMAGVFEALVLSTMQQNSFSVGGVRAMIRKLESQAGGLRRQLRFRWVIRNGAGHPVALQRGGSRARGKKKPPYARGGHPA